MPLTFAIGTLRTVRRAAGLTTMAAMAFVAPALAQEFELPSPEMDARGSISAITVKVQRDASDVVKSERLEFSPDGKLVTAKITYPDGAVTTARYEYSRMALAKRQLNAEAFKPKKAMLFRETGAFQGVAIAGPQHNLVCDRVFDSMSVSPNPVSRDICLPANGSDELNEITKVDPDDSRVSVTQLNLGDKRRASWWIQRDKKGKVLVDHLAYTDLSFDRRFHHADGTVEERSFRSLTNEYEVNHWDASGRLVRSTRSMPGGASEEQRFSYDANGRLVHVSASGRSAHEVDFAYVNDDQGNWTERRASEKGQTVELATRNIEYHTAGPSGRN